MRISDRLLNILGVFAHHTDRMVPARQDHTVAVCQEEPAGHQTPAPASACRLAVFVKQDHKAAVCQEEPKARRIAAPVMVPVVSLMFRSAALLDRQHKDMAVRSAAPNSAQTLIHPA
jgi:hypothetical protein